MKILPADKWLQIEMNVHVIPQSPLNREAFSTLVAVKRLVLFRSVHTAHVLLQVRNLDK